MSRPCTHRAPRRHKPAAARHLLLRLARQLGLDRRDVTLYAELACGRPWGSLAAPDLALVLDTLTEVVACRGALRHARARRREEGRHGG